MHLLRHGGHRSAGQTGATVFQASQGRTCAPPLGGRALDMPSTPRHRVDNRHKEALCAPAPAKKWEANRPEIVSFTGLGIFPGNPVNFRLQKGVFGTQRGPGYSLFTGFFCFLCFPVTFEWHFLVFFTGKRLLLPNTVTIGQWTLEYELFFLCFSPDFDFFLSIR